MRLYLAALCRIFNIFDLEIVFHQDAGISQEIDTRLLLKINEYVKEVKNIQEMKRLLKLYGYT